MTRTIGFFVFDGMEELDFCGPWEVFGMANEVLAPAAPAFAPIALAQNAAPVRCAHGLRILPDATLSQAPKIDILLVPGGVGTRTLAADRAVLDWLAKTAASAEWVTSVCTGALLLSAAGLAKGKKITTHYAFIDALRSHWDIGEVLEGVRYVRDGSMVTAAGVSAGIDMALWLTGTVADPDLARAVQKRMQYEPAPPFAA